MSEDAHYPTPEDLSDPDEAALLGWLRWWHWLVLVGLFLFGLVYYPLWRFEQHWKQIQPGDSLDRVKRLLGDTGVPSYSVQGVGPGGAYEAYVFRRYWRNYEVLVSPVTHQVLSKNASGTPATPGPSNQPGTTAGGAIKK